jgi:hypothetical protein
MFSIEREVILEVKKFPLRMPVDLHATLVKLAETDRRSMHAEILVLLQEAIEMREEEAEKHPKENRLPVTSEQAA